MKTYSQAKSVITSLFSAMLLMAIASGCASVGKNFDSRKVSEIKKGETTEDDLIKMFGPPSQRTVSSEAGPTLIWIYTQATVKGATFIPVVGSFAGGMNTKNKSLSVMIGSDGKVSTYSYSGGGFETTNSTGPDPEHDRSTNAVSSLKPPRS